MHYLYYVGIAIVVVVLLNIVLVVFLTLASRDGE